MSETRTISRIEDILAETTYTFEKEGGDRYVDRQVTRFSGRKIITVGSQKLAVVDLFKEGFVAIQVLPEMALPTYSGAVIVELRANGIRGAIFELSSGEWRGTDGRYFGHASLKRHLQDRASTIDVLEPRKAVIADTIKALRQLDRDKCSNGAWADLLAQELGVDA